MGIFWLWISGEPSVESQIEYRHVVAAARGCHGKRFGKRRRARPSQHPDAIDRPGIVLVGPGFGNSVREEYQPVARPDPHFPLREGRMLEGSQHEPCRIETLDLTGCTQ